MEYGDTPGNFDIGKLWDTGTGTFRYLLNG